jgi:hypothetical protein
MMLPTRSDEKRPLRGNRGATASRRGAMAEPIRSRPRWLRRWRLPRAPVSGALSRSCRASWGPGGWLGRRRRCRALRPSARDGTATNEGLGLGSGRAIATPEDAR